MNKNEILKFILENVDNEGFLKVKISEHRKSSKGKHTNRVLNIWDPKTGQTIKQWEYKASDLKEV